MMDVFIIVSCTMISYGRELLPCRKQVFSSNRCHMVKLYQRILQEDRHRSIIEPHCQSSPLIFRRTFRNPFECCLCMPVLWRTRNLTPLSFCTFPEKRNRTNQAILIQAGTILFSCLQFRRLLGHTRWYSRLPLHAGDQQDWQCQSSCGNRRMTAKLCHSCNNAVAVSFVSAQDSSGATFNFFGNLVPCRCKTAII